MSVPTEARDRIQPDLAGSPAATRHRSAAWKDPRLVVGVVLVAVSALLGASLLGGADDTVGVWATRAAIAEGQPVGPGDVVRREIRFAEQADADHYLAAEAPLPEGSVLVRSVGAGELLPRSALSTGGSAANVEVPLAVASAAVPVTLRVGSVVDVWVAPDPALAGRAGSGDDAAESVLVLHDVAVLSLARGGGALGAGATRQVVVGVRPGQEDALPTALARMATGTVVLTRKQ